MNTLSLFTQPHISTNLYDFLSYVEYKKYILNNVLTVFVHLMKVSVAKSKFKPNWLSYEHFYCVQQKKVSEHKGE